MVSKNLAMSPLIVENFLFFAKSLIKCRLRHLLNTALYKDSTFNDDIAKNLDEWPVSVYHAYMLCYPYDTYTAKPFVKLL